MRPRAVTPEASSERRRPRSLNTIAASIRPPSSSAPAPWGGGRALPEARRALAGGSIVAAEIARLGRYPRITTERRALGVAGARLRRDLAAVPRTTGAPEAQAAAFDRFAVAVAAASTPLQGAPVPSALRPAREQETARTAELAASARGLARALRKGEVPTPRGSSTASAGRPPGAAMPSSASRSSRSMPRPGGSSPFLEVAEERQRLDRELR